MEAGARVLNLKGPFPKVVPINSRAAHQKRIMNDFFWAA